MYRRKLGLAWALRSSHSLFSDLLGQEPDSVSAEESHEFARQLGEGCFSGIRSLLNFFSFQVTNSNCCRALLCFVRYGCLTVLSPLSTYCVECFTYTFWFHSFDGWSFYRGLQLCVLRGAVWSQKTAHQCLPNLHSYQRSPRKDCRVRQFSSEAWMLWVLGNAEISHPEEGAECDILRCFLEQHEFFPLVYRGYLRGYRRESLPQVLRRSVCPRVHDSVGDSRWL